MAKTLFDLSPNKKDYFIVKLLQEKYDTDTVIGTDGLEHYARLEMSFDKYVEKMIEQYLNSMDVEDGGYSFRGDGVGDFETSSDVTTEECISKYIKHCQDQIQLAYEYLIEVKK